MLDIHQFVWKDTNKKRGYGYITFDDTDVVDKIVLLGVHDIAGVKLQVKLKARRKPNKYISVAREPYCKESKSHFFWKKSK